MSSTLRAAAVGVATLVLASSGEARAGCSAEQALKLTAAGFLPEQVVQICAVLQPGTGGALGPDTSDPPSAFGSDVLTPEIGWDEAWTKFVRGDTYILHNKSDAGSAFLLLSTGRELAWESFSVEVRFTHEAVAEGVVGPALAFGIGGDRTRLLTITHGGDCKAAEITAEGITVRDNRRNPAWAVGDFEWVEIGVARRNDGVAELLVRGRPTGLTVPADAASGPIGIAVFGIGAYEFRRFRYASPAIGAGTPGAGG